MLTFDFEREKTVKSHSLSWCLHTKSRFPLPGTKARGKAHFARTYALTTRLEPLGSQIDANIISTAAKQELFVGTDYTANVVIMFDRHN